MRTQVCEVSLLQGEQAEETKEHELVSYDGGDEARAEHAKNRRRKIKRLRLKRKIKEARQREEQHQTQTIIPQDTTLTIAHETPTKQSQAWNNFTFTSPIKPPPTSIDNTQATSLSPPPTGSASVFDTQAEQSIPEANATPGSSSDTCVNSEVPSERRSPIIYCNDQGDAFDTQLSPLASYESLDLSIDSAQTIPYMERYPVGGRAGAVSAPSTPTYGQSFWGSDIASLISESFELRKGDENRHTFSKALIRRANSMDLQALDWRRGLALDTLSSPQKEDEEVALTVEGLQLNTQIVKGPTPVVALDSTDDGKCDDGGDGCSVHKRIASQEKSSTTPAISSIEEEAQAVVLQNLEIQCIDDDDTYEDEDYPDEAAFSKKKPNRLYTPSGDFQSDLQEIYRKGSLFFRKYDTYGEVQNIEGQYSVVPFSRVKDTVFEAKDPAGPECTVWVYHDKLGIDFHKIYYNPVRWEMKKECAEEEEKRLARLKSNLSSKLWDLKERLEKKAEKIPEVSPKKRRVVGGVGAKWAAMRRKNITKPKKVIEEVKTKEHGDT